MRIEKFKRETPESLIILNCEFPTHQIALALDTGASHTTIDLTALQIAGYDVGDSIGTTKIETAGGIIDAFLFKVKKIKALGIQKKNYMVCSYDFFAHQVLAEFDGVLGIDFVEHTKICIDFKKSEISIQD